MPRSKQKEIFEDFFQGRLESSTEKLSGLLEAEGEPDRQAVINTRADAKKQLDNMRELLESKGEPDTWTDSCEQAVTLSVSQSVSFVAVPPRSTRSGPGR